jgi:hypothetical protein
MFLLLSPKTISPEPEAGFPLIVPYQKYAKEQTAKAPYFKTRCRLLIAHPSSLIRSKME